MSDAPQWSALQPALFNFLIHNTDSAIDCTLSKTRDGIKLSGAADMLEGKDVVQRNLDRLHTVFESEG